MCGRIKIYQAFFFLNRTETTSFIDFRMHKYSESKHYGIIKTNDSYDNVGNAKYLL